MATWAGLKEHREKLRAQGHCTKCHKPNDRAPLSTCSTCYQRSKVALRRLRKGWRGTGRCIACSMPTEGRSIRCRRCLEGRHRRYRTAVDEGRCAECMRPMPEPGWAYCPVCSDRRNLRQNMVRGVRKWRS